MMITLYLALIGYAWFCYSSGNKKSEELKEPNQTMFEIFEEMVQVHRSLRDPKYNKPIKSKEDETNEQYL